MIISLEKKYSSECKDIFLHDLLVQSLDLSLRSKNEARNIFNQYLANLKIAANVAKVIHSKNYHEIDPQVGENQCQYRACFFLCWVENCSNLCFGWPSIRQSFVRDIKCCISKIVDILGSVEKIKMPNRNNRISIRGLFEQHGLTIKICKEFYFFCQCYFLTVYAKKDSAGMYIGIDYSKVTMETCLSKNSAKNIVRKFQQEVSYVSCQFISFIHKYKNIQKANELHIPILKLCKRDEDNRYCLPVFISSKILLEYIIYKKQCICLEIKHNKTGSIDYLFFQAKSGVMCEISRFDVSLLENKSFIMFRSCSSFNRSSFKEIGSISEYVRYLGIENILLANWASHPQYPGSEAKGVENAHTNLYKKHGLNYLGMEYNKYRDFSEKYGCTSSFREAIFIEHVYLIGKNKLLSKTNLYTGYNKDRNKLSIDTCFDFV